MLKDSPLVAFVGVAELERARAFYGETLGLEIVSIDEFAIEAKVAGTMLRITKVPTVTVAGYTVLGFAVTDIEARIDALAAKGITFERFAFLREAQDPRGIWQAPSGSRIAWFKDPDGNMLSLAEF